MAPPRFFHRDAVIRSELQTAITKIVNIHKPRIHRLQTRIVLAFTLLLLLIQTDSLTMINSILPDRPNSH
jgi:hypothetical protein